MTSRQFVVALLVSSACLFVAGLLTGLTARTPCATSAPEVVVPAGVARNPALGTTAQVAAIGGCPQSTAQAVYTRGALSTAMRDRCEKEFELRAGKRVLGMAYGTPNYRAYTFEHGEPSNCEEMERVLREVSDR